MQPRYLAPLREAFPITVTIPTYSDLILPTLQAAIAVGGSTSIAELDAAVIERERPTPEQQSVPLRGGPQTDELLGTLLAMSPNAFERFAQRLLREAGFTSGPVTGRAATVASTVSAPSGILVGCWRGGLTKGC